MTTWIALLRAVNLGAASTLPMAVLKAMCEEAGLARVRTDIASGNVAFDIRIPEARIKALLEARLLGHAGKRIEVLVRSAAEMAAVVTANPFPERPGNRVVAIFLDAPPPRDATETATGGVHEELALGTREICWPTTTGWANRP